MKEHYNEAALDPLIGSSKLNHSIDKHGSDAFVACLLDEVPHEEGNDTEVFFIEEYNTFLGPLGLNLTPGVYTAPCTRMAQVKELASLY